jgi:hypothetical protein
MVEMVEMVEMKNGARFTAQGARKKFKKRCTAHGARRTENTFGKGVHFRDIIRSEIGT